MEDVYDLSWSPDSLNLISASVDNTAMVWDVLKGKSQCILGDHKNFVQGVAWDPKNQFLITLSTDRLVLHSHRHRMTTVLINLSSNF